MTDHYKVMPNEDIYRAIEKSMEGVEHTITTAGTLDRCRRFFVTVALGEHRGFTVAGDKFQSYVNFLTSHDGSLALQFYDSMTRIVCNNTLNMSLYGRKNMHMKIRHTSGADMELDHISQFLNTLLMRREEFSQDMSRLAEQKVSHEEAYDAITGWQHERVGKPAKMSTRSQNAIEGIYELFHRGKGNLGETRYDVWNGLTDYYSNGDGVGKQVEPLQRVANGLFGGASNLKVIFTNRILQPEGWESMVRTGRMVNGRESTVFMPATQLEGIGVN
jgi:phage/plasmid-like protein (TIGR03299 family)